jgi:hypothetical protein
MTYTLTAVQLDSLGAFEMSMTAMAATSSEVDASHSTFYEAQAGETP